MNQTKFVLAKEVEALPNLIMVTKNFYSGAEPDADFGFLKLKSLGIQTIISVDGALPSVKKAENLGMEYVHVPIGYKGITKEQAATLTSIIKKKKAPFYIHCHHGRHRGPSAAAVLLIRNQMISKEKALEFVKKAGLSPHYKGLWETIRKASTEINDPTLAASLVSQARTSDYTQAMVEIDEYYEALKKISKNEWKILDESPDKTPAHTALILLEKMIELPRATNHIANDEKLYKNVLKKNIDAVKQLENTLRKPSFSGVQAQLKFRTLQKSCMACHTEYRD